MLQLMHARKDFVECPPQMTKEKEAGRFEPSTLGIFSAINNVNKFFVNFDIFSPLETFLNLIFLLY